MDIHYFESAEEFRQWLSQNHAQAKELQVGFYKKNASQKGISYKEAVDQALCFGWIDGITHRVDEERYTIRFTPRRPNSNWSEVNLKRVIELNALGLMEPAGLKMYEARTAGRSGLYSHEQGAVKLDEPFESEFQSHPQAWAFFQAQSASYRKQMIWWVMSAKQEATRRKRLAELIEVSEKGQRKN